MAKIRTKSDLAQALMDELAWRRQELTNFKRISPARLGASEGAISRAYWLMIYAHWEGFVKAAGIAYFTYVMSSGVKLKRLKSNFSAVHLSSLVRDISEAKQGRFLCDAIGEIVKALDSENFKTNPEVSVKTKSNLTYDRFLDLLALFGIDNLKYKTSQVMIDLLVENRNKIAHGNFMLVDLASCNLHCDRVIALMDCLKDDMIDMVDGNFHLLPHQGSVVVRK